MKLHSLEKNHRKRKKRSGRGPSSKRGKTCGRGTKGDKARSGYKTRAGKEGGQLPLFQKLPTRGFSNARHKKVVLSLNLDRVDSMFNDGECINYKTLLSKGVPARKMRDGIKLLGSGELKKKVTVEVNLLSKSAEDKLKAAGIDFKLVSKKQEPCNT